MARAWARGAVWARAAAVARAARAMARHQQPRGPRHAPTAPAAARQNAESTKMMFGARRAGQRSIGCGGRDREDHPRRSTTGALCMHGGRPRRAGPAPSPAPARPRIVMIGRPAAPMCAQNNAWHGTQRRYRRLTVEGAGGGGQQRRRQQQQRRAHDRVPRHHGRTAPAAARRHKVPGAVRPTCLDFRLAVGTTNARC